MNVDATSLLDQENKLALQRLRQVYSFLFERARQRKVEMAEEGPEAPATTEAQMASNANAAALYPRTE